MVTKGHFYMSVTCTLGDLAGPYVCTFRKILAKEEVVNLVERKRGRAGGAYLAECWRTVTTPTILKGLTALSGESAV